MVDLTSNADEGRLARFATRFLNHYGAHGFQSLAKRDVDLLLFYELELAGLIDPNASNHDVARQLRLTPRRVVGLRRDAWARWAEQNEITDHLRGTLVALFEPEALETLLRENRKRWREDGLVPLLLEHPSDRSEMEQLLKARHSVPSYPRNREVLLVPHAQLLSITAELGGEVGPKKLDRIQKAFAKDADLEAFLTTDLRELSWAKARAALGTTLARVMQKAAVDAGARALGGVFGPLLS